MMGLIRGWVRKPMGSLRGDGTGLLRPKRLDNWSRAMVATFPVRTSTRFWIIPLVSLLLAAVVEVKASTRAVVVASSSDTSGIIQNLVDVLTGKVATIALDQLSNLLGLNNPVPSPLSDPIGFLTHPLISPIILAAVTLNPPALAP